MGQPQWQLGESGSGAGGRVRVWGDSWRTAHSCLSPQIPYSASSPGSYTVSGAMGPWGPHWVTRRVAVGAFLTFRLPLCAGTSRRWWAPWHTHHAQPWRYEGLGGEGKGVLGGGLTPRPSRTIFPRLHQLQREHVHHHEPHGARRWQG